MDTINYRHKTNINANHKLLNLSDSFDLIDVWREFNGNNKRYTWFGPYMKMSRLDYFLLTSDLQCNVAGVGMGTAYKSDHCPVYIETNFIQQSRGRGTWKFNNSLLNDPDYVQLVKNTTLEVISQYSIDLLQTIHLTLCQMNSYGKHCGFTIRGKTIKYASFKKKKKRREGEINKQRIESVV